MTHQPTRENSHASASRAGPLDAEPAHLTTMPGGTPAAVRHYIVGCRASALVLEREGHAQEAGCLRAAAEAAEAPESRMQQPHPAGGGRR